VGCQHLTADMPSLSFSSSYHHLIVLLYVDNVCRISSELQVWNHKSWKIQDFCSEMMFRIGARWVLHFWKFHCQFGHCTATV
jgi:hypothetical protein